MLKIKYIYDQIKNNPEIIELKKKTLEFCNNDEE